MSDPKTPISINERAGQIMGMRMEGITGGAIIIDFPCELGYACPICGCNDERLEWSEYNGFLWCEACNKDIPSALCQPTIDRATETFLDTVASAKLRA